ncbi:DUF2637 domain-containing protein [Streptomyces sp. NBC_01456]|uniref:DUF2637 domain-containing protein n=1 Tax=Streptomyces sp. NBC_01456 TaxID=2975868 RepID=UPI002E33BF7B|nr:DUF2637 domain-containing protein [Streptomyces sp. NBC_01456]
MAVHHPIASPTAAPVSVRWGPLAASVAMTAGFAFLAFRLSFAALTALAIDHGVADNVVWMFACLVDGGAVVGTVGVVMARRTGRRTWPYWATVAGFAATSLGFNVAHSDGTAAGIAIAVTPPAAQLVATELLVRMLPTADASTATVADVAPSLAAAEAAARTATAAATAARDSLSAAVSDATAAAERAAVRAEDAAERFSQVSAGGTDASVPVEQLDLAALVAAVYDEPPFTAGDTDALAPEPSPLAPVFAAPPAPAGAHFNGEGDGVLLVDDEVPPEWVEAYRSVERATGKRPTAERLGTELGLKRTRGGEIREQVEAALEPPCVVIVP